MLDILIREPATQTAQRTVETVYFLVLATAFYLIGGGWGTAVAGGALLAVAGWWNLARLKAVGIPAADYVCVMPAWQAAAQTTVWGACWCVGPMMVAVNDVAAYRIAGLVIVGCGLAEVWTHHDCRFSKHCEPKRGGSVI